MDETTEHVWRTPDGDYRTAPLGAPAVGTTEVLSTEPAGDQPPPGSRRKLLLWAAVTPVILALVAAVVLGGVYVWSQSRWFVVERDGGIAVQHGVAPFAGYEKSDVDVAVDLLPAAERAELADAISVNGRQAAAQTIANLHDAAEKCRGTLEAPCPVRALHAPVITFEPSVFPHGNRLELRWSGIDERGGVTVRVQVNGEEPTGSCKPVLTGAGECSFKGTYGKKYKVTTTTSGPEGTKEVVTEAEATTYAKPSVAVRKGKKFKSKTTDTQEKGSFCKAILDVTGLKPYKRYSVTITTSGHKPLTTGYTVTTDGSFSGWIYSYADPNPGSWLRVETAGITSKKVTWECGGLS